MNERDQDAKPDESAIQMAVNDYLIDVVTALLFHAFDLVDCEHPGDEFYLRINDSSVKLFKNIICEMVTASHVRQKICILIKYRYKNELKHLYNRREDFIRKNSPFDLSKIFNFFIAQNRDEKTQSCLLIFCTNISLLGDEVKAVLRPTRVDAKIAYDFAWPITRDCYAIDVRNIQERFKNDLFGYLEKNSVFRILVKDLAKSISSETQIDLFPVCETYRPFIEQCIATNSRHASGRKDCYKVNTHFLYGSSEFMIAFEIEYRKLLKCQYDKPVLEDIERKGIYIQNKSVSGRKPYAVPKQVREQQIMDFFEQLVICEQVVINKDEVIKKLSVEKVLPPALHGSTSSIYDKFRDRVWAWQSNSNRLPLAKSHMRGILNDIGMLVLFDHFKYISQQHVNTNKELNLLLKKDSLTRIQLFYRLSSDIIKSSTRTNVQMLICNYHPAIVNQILELLPVKTDEQRIFLQCNQFEQNKDTIRYIFEEAKCDLILVIDCKQIPNIVQSIKTIVSSLNDRIDRHREIKVVIINQNSFSIDSCREPFHVGDLTEQCKFSVIENHRTTTLYGTKVNTEEFFQDRDRLDAFLEVFFSDNAQLKRSLNQNNFTKMEDTYIMRCTKKLENTQCATADKVSSENIWKNREKLFGQTGVDEILDNHISYETFKYQAPGSLSTKNHASKKFHVILGEAGSGKSLHMIWLANYLETESPSRWINRFTLNEHSTDFDEFVEISRTMDELNALRLLFELIYFNFQTTRGVVSEADEKRKTAQQLSGMFLFSDKFVKLDENKTQLLSSEQLVLLKIFVHKFNKQELVILMDGFDQLPPNCKEIVVQWQTILVKFDGVQKIYLASRSHDQKPFFKDCSLYRLEKVTIKEQNNYIRKFLDNEMKQLRRCYPTLDFTTDKFINMLRMFFDNLMELPLFLSEGLNIMLPLIQKNLTAIEDGTEKFKSQMLSDCVESFELLRMIEILIDKKLSIANQQATGQILTRDWVDKVHSTLAVYIFLGKNKAVGLLSDVERKELYDLIEKVKNGSDKFGLIAGVWNDVPIFVHEIFVKYFTAVWFSHRHDDLVKDILKSHVYESDDKKEIRYFLDKIICKRNLRCQLHNAILDNSKAKVDAILRENLDSINERDDWGRTPLQLAILYGSKENDEIVCLLLDHNYQTDFNSNDRFFQWSTLDYAHYRYKSNEEEMYLKQFILLKSLNKELKTNHMKALINFIQKTPNKCTQTQNHLSSICCIRSFERAEDSNDKNN